MGKNKSLSSNIKKRKILIGCAIGGTAVLLAGAGVGVGYAVWHNKNGGGDQPLVNDSGLAISTDISTVETDAEADTVIAGTFKSINFEVKSLELTGTDVNKFDGFMITDIATKAFEVKVKTGTTPGLYKLQLQANGDGNLQSNDISITVVNTINQYTVSANYTYLQYGGANPHQSIELTTTKNGTPETGVTYSFVGTRPTYMDEIIGNVVSMNDHVYQSGESIQIKAEKNNKQLGDAIKIDVLPDDGVPVIYDTLELSSHYLNIDNSANTITATVKYFNTTETPSAVSWSGDDGMVNFTPIGSWNNGVGVFTITLTGQAAKADLELTCTLTIDSKTYSTIQVTLHLTTNQTFVSLTKVSGPTELRYKGDKIIYQYIVDNPSGNTTWTPPTPVSGVHFDYQNDNSTSLMIITATANLSSTSAITITATNNSVSASATIDVYEAVYETVPINSTYFKFATSTAANDTIVGFSDAVVADPTMLTDYNAIDFTGSSITDVSANARFFPSVFQDWAIQKLNLSMLKFHFNANGQSGFQTFAGCNFSSLIKLDMTGTDFASKVTTDLPGTDKNINTADSTFYGANLSGLSSLDWQNAIFATTSMTATGNVSTAANTFNGAILSGLSSLDWTGVVFAAGDTGANPDTMTTGSVNTASNTFSNANLSGLLSLDLKDATFAVESMTTGSNTTSVATAYYTFYNSNLSKLSSLHFKDGIFAAASMVTAANVYTATYTFGNANLSGLLSLDLKDATFAVASMTASSNIATARNTFDNANLSGISSIKWADAIFSAAGMTTTGTVNTASYTFNGANLTGWSSIDFKNAKFGGGGTYANPLTTTGYVYTAAYTFNDANLSGTSSIQWAPSGSTGNIFASMYMSASGRVLTAAYTFSNANLSGLSSLDLKSISFAASYMTASTGNIYTATYTFANSNLSKLSSLDFKDAIFTVPYMYISATTQGTVYTARGMFSAANLSGLSSLDLRDADFEGLFTGATDYASRTFYGTNLSALSDVYIPSDDHVWSQTFDTATYLASGTVHGATAARPTWFNSTWFSGWAYVQYT